MNCRKILLPFALLSLISAPRLARADEQMRPLAISGDWMAMAHHVSMTAPADMCLVVNSSAGVAIRASSDGVQLRVINPKWALPTGVDGEITVSVAEWKAVLKIDDNTDTMVNAELIEDAVVPMFTAMDKSSVMVVSVGKAKPISLSLAGSTRATNAFRTCAHIEGNTKAPGANPFE